MSTRLSDPAGRVLERHMTTLGAMTKMPTFAQWLANSLLDTSTVPDLVYCEHPEHEGAPLRSDPTAVQHQCVLCNRLLLQCCAVLPRYVSEISMEMQRGFRVEDRKGKPYATVERLYNSKHKCYWVVCKCCVDAGQLTFDGSVVAWDNVWNDQLPDGVTLESMKASKRDNVTTVGVQKKAPKKTNGKRRRVVEDEEDDDDLDFIVDDAAEAEARAEGGSFSCEGSDDEEDEEDDE